MTSTVMVIFTRLVSSRADRSPSPDTLTGTKDSPAQCYITLFLSIHCHRRESGILERGPWARILERGGGG